MKRIAPRHRPGRHARIDEVMKAQRLDAILVPRRQRPAIAAKPGYPTVIVPFAWFRTRKARRFLRVRPEARPLRVTSPDGVAANRVC